MRILHWTDAYAPSAGGTENFVRNLALRQQALGHAVAILTDQIPGTPDFERPDDIPVHRLPATRALASGALQQFRQLTVQASRIRREFNPDVVHVHFLGAFAWTESLCRPPSDPGPVVTVHGTPDSLRLPFTLRNRVLLGSRLVVAVSRNLESELAALIPGLDRRLRCIPNGVPAPVHPRSPIPTAPVVFTMLGRLVPSKGFLAALTAFIEVASEAPGRQALWIVGEGSEQARLQAVARQSGLPPDVIRFLPWIHPDDVPGLLATTSVVVVPSLVPESFGLVAVEAALAGRPVIASDAGGLREIVVPDETGLLLPPGDHAALTTAFRWALANLEALRRMGEAATRRAAIHFTLDRCTDEYLAAYTQS